MNRYKNWLERQRRKTDSEKRDVAFLISFLITGSIFFVWLITIIYSFSDLGPSQDFNNVSEISPTEPVLSGFKNIFKQ